MTSLNNRIGIIDGGIGGLTVAGRMHAKFPGADLTYYGDSRNMPYSTHPSEWIRTRAQALVDIVDPISDRLVIACNTISTIAGDLKRKRGDILDIISPTILHMRRNFQGRCLLVIGTSTTIDSRAYEDRELMDKGVDIKTIALLKLGKLIEEFGTNSQKIVTYLRDELRGKIDKMGLQSGCDINLLLGCTHYPLVESSIRDAIIDITGCSSLQVIDPGEIFVNNMSEGDDTNGDGNVKIVLNEDDNGQTRKVAEQIIKQVSLCGANLSFVNI